MGMISCNQFYCKFTPRHHLCQWCSITTMHFSSQTVICHRVEKFQRTNAVLKLQEGPHVVLTVGYRGHTSCLTEQWRSFQCKDLSDGSGASRAWSLWKGENLTPVNARKLISLSAGASASRRQSLSEWKWRNDLLVNSPLWLTSQITRGRAGSVAAWRLGQTSLVIDVVRRDGDSAVPLRPRGSITKASRWWFAGQRRWRAGSKVTQLGWLHYPVSVRVCVLFCDTAGHQEDTARCLFLTQLICMSYRCQQLSREVIQVRL